MPQSIDKTATFFLDYLEKPMAVNVSFPKGVHHTIKYLNRIVKFFLLNEDQTFTLTPKKQCHVVNPSNTISLPLLALDILFITNKAIILCHSILSIYSRHCLLFGLGHHYCYQKSIYYTLLKVSVFYYERGRVTYGATHDSTWIV